MGPAAPVIGVAAAGEPGPGALSPLGVAGRSSRPRRTGSRPARSGPPAHHPGPGAAHGRDPRPPAHTHLVDVWVHQDEIAALSRAGDRGQHDLASDTGQVPAPRQVGIPVDVGTDEAASNARQNMLEAAEAAAILQKLTGLDARALTAGDILAKATVEGRRR
jgi:hypothetical protein